MTNAINICKIEFFRLSLSNWQNQVFTTSFWIHQEWNDSSLSWRPEDFGGISNIKVPADMVWKPDMGKITIKPTCHGIGICIYLY